MTPTTTEKTAAELASEILAVIEASYAGADNQERPAMLAFYRAFNQEPLGPTFGGAGALPADFEATIGEFRQRVEATPGFVELHPHFTKAVRAARALQSTWDTFRRMARP